MSKQKLTHGQYPTLTALLMPTLYLHLTLTITQILTQKLIATLNLYLDKIKPVATVTEANARVPNELKSETDLNVPRQRSMNLSVSLQTMARSCTRNLSGSAWHLSHQALPTRRH